MATPDLQTQPQEISPQPQTQNPKKRKRSSSSASSSKKRKPNFVLLGDHDRLLHFTGAEIPDKVVENIVSQLTQNQPASLAFKVEPLEPYRIRVYPSKEEEELRKMKYRKAYRQRPDVEAKRQQRASDPKLKEQRKAYASRPEIKQRKAQAAKSARIVRSQLKKKDPKLLDQLIEEYNKERGNSKHARYGPSSSTTSSSDSGSSDEESMTVEE